MAGIFKAYDIRGIYGETITEDIVFKIGRAFATLTRAQRVVVGRDMRPHSVPLAEALIEGLTMQGADVVDLGLASTPICYYANGSLGADAGAMITASHNTGEWNGMKLCRADAVPISGTTGLADIERIVAEEAYDDPAVEKGAVTTQDVLPAYREHVQKLAHLGRPVRIAADMANAMGIMEAKALDGLIEMDCLYDNYDGTFPNHEANPLMADTLVALREKVCAEGYDFGVAFDGDADRAGFVDEKGGIVPMDLLSALIAKELLTKEAGVIFYDLRSSWSVREIIEESGGIPMMCRVGHSFIKAQMREENAIFAGELSGHYYFRDNYTTESSAMAVLCVANIVSHSDKPLSELIAPLRRYVASGEINLKVADKEGVFAALKAKYRDGKQIELDGVSVEYDDWWFNVRASNTESLVRLNLEAKTRECMEEKRDEVLGVIGG